MEPLGYGRRWGWRGGSHCVDVSANTRHRSDLATRTIGEAEPSNSTQRWHFASQNETTERKAAAGKAREYWASVNHDIAHFCERYRRTRLQTKKIVDAIVLVVHVCATRSRRSTGEERLEHHGRSGDSQLVVLCGFRPSAS